MTHSKDTIDIYALVQAPADSTKEARYRDTKIQDYYTARRH